MKTLITVSWAVTTKVEVDPLLMSADAYREKIQHIATVRAAEGLNWKDGIVTDCEAFPSLVE